METTSDHLKRVKDLIEKSAQRAGRNAADITLIAVTKTVPFERIRPFLEAGIRHVGENRVQEAMEKYSELRTQSSEMPTLHLIGQLQSNKAKKAVAFFDVIQSLDRLVLAQDLNRHAAAIGKKQSCLIEVKISPEESKSGLPPEQLEEFLGQVQSLKSLEIRGLMGIAPITATPQESRPYFAKLRTLFEKASEVRSPKSEVNSSTSDIGPRTTFNILSMGMSSDFDVAIEEGSTMVRLGTALFGSRTVT